MLSLYIMLSLKSGWFYRVLSCRQVWPSDASWEATGASLAFGCKLRGDWFCNLYICVYIYIYIYMQLYLIIWIIISSNIVNTYIYVYVCIYIYIYICICIYHMMMISNWRHPGRQHCHLLRLGARQSANYIYIYRYMYTYIYIYFSLSLSIYIYIYAYAYMYIYIYIHTYKLCNE